MVRASNPARCRRPLPVKDSLPPEPGAAGPLSPEDIRALAEHAPVGVFRTDAAGHWVYANPACLAIFGLTAEQAMGLGWQQSVHPDDREAVVQRCLAQADGSLHVEHRVRRPDGSERTVVARKWRLHGAAAGQVGAVTDITADAQLQSQLRSTLQLLDRTGQIAGVGGWDIDLRTRQVRWSAQTYRIYERPLDWPLSIDDGVQHYAPESQPVIAALVDRAIRLGEPFDTELGFITATGRQLRVRAVGDVERQGDVPVRLFGALKDVTVQRAAADALQASREQLRHLYDETPALMASVDRRGRVCSASRRLLERLGLPRDAVVGRPASRLLAGPAAERRAARLRLLTPLRQAQSSAEGFRALPLRLAHADGSVVHTLLSAVLDRSGVGETGPRLLGVFEDISEAIRRQAELARERALREQLESQARELARLADERREMLDVLAHEVRQPLNNASAALQSAAAMPGALRDDAGLERLQRAHGVIGDVVAQIDNTLAAAALLVGKRELERADTDIDVLLGLVVAEFPLADRRRIVIERQAPTRTASMDLSLVRLALRNLLANALRHAPAGSRVTLRVADSDEPLALLLDVEDAGPGVPPALRSRLFERGARGPASRGQGLGLHIARRALQLHGGTAELLHSEPGSTVFRLVLVQDGA
jgi:PAS domain S-box-containing protein